jgi:PIN domain nuclease of toxin-antitoxin system
VILLDTNALLWLAESDPRLGSEARQIIAGAATTGDILVSPVSFWEIGLLLNKGRISLSKPLPQWAEAVVGRSEIRIVPIDAAVAIEAGLLPGSLHGDPGDRFLIATGRVMRASLLTSDRAILAYAKAGHLQAIDARR